MKMGLPFTSHSSLVFLQVKYDPNDYIQFTIDKVIFHLRRDMESTWVNNAILLPQQERWLSALQTQCAAD